MSTVAAHVATSAVKNWMSAYVRSAKNVSAVHMIVSAKTDLRPNSLSRATGTVALIYHNIRCTPHAVKPALSRLYVKSRVLRQPSVRDCPFHHQMDFP